MVAKRAAEIVVTQFCHDLLEMGVVRSLQQFVDVTVDEYLWTWPCRLTINFALSDSIQRISGQLLNVAAGSVKFSMLLEALVNKRYEWFESGFKPSP